MDNRKEKTKNAIKEAFLELSKTKDINKISVTEITEKANVGRKTFYLHYGCINDVFLDFINTLEVSIRNSVDVYFSKTNTNILKIFEDLNEIIIKNLYLAKRLAKDDSLPIFRNMFENLLQNIIINIYAEKYDVKSDNLKYYALYFASGIARLYIDWLNNKMDVDINELTRIVARSTFLGYKELIETKKK